MDSRAFIPVTTSSNFEVEGTIDPKWTNKLWKYHTGMSEKKNSTYLSFSVPKIDARYSAIAIMFTVNDANGKSIGNNKVWDKKLSLKQFVSN